MAHKPCELVLIKRYPQDETLRQAYEPDYYVAHFRPIGEGNYDWVKFQSNATLFNKRDARRDLLPHLSTTAQHQIIVNHYCITTAFELVEFIEKKSFGWIIRRPYVDRGETKYQHLAGITGQPETEAFRWLNSPMNASLLYTDQKDTIMSVLKQTWPTSPFEAIELFTQ